MKNWNWRMWMGIVVLAISAPQCVNGQGGHHWTEHYGNRSMLLNGTVIGSSEDLGAVYYNPARIAQFESPAFVISAKVYEYKTVTIADGLGEDIDLNTSNFGGGPSLVSGTFNLKFLPKHKFAYAFLTKTRFDESVTFGIEDFGDFVRAFDGEEYFSGEIAVRTKIRDEWIGGAWSYPISDQWSVGLSGFYSAVERAVGTRIQLQAFSETEGTGMYLNRREYDFETHNLILKGGVSWQLENLTAGLTVKAPRIQGLGRGNTRYEEFLAGIDTTGDGTTDDIYVINSQRDLDATYKTPLSIGAGTGIRIGRSLIHLSAEWFDKVPLYTIIQSEPFTGQSTGETIQMTVVDEFRSVINFGGGAEVFVNPKLALFASFATDYSVAPQDITRFSELENVTNNTTFRADIYHFGFGTDFKTKFANLTLGATYATSKETFDRTIEIDEGMDSMTSTAEMIYGRWRFLVGFEFPFLNKAKEKLENGEE